MDPSSILPLEVIHKIFHHYLKDRRIPVQSFDFSDGPWVLGQVNSAWRSASLASKSLWSSITIIVIERRLDSAYFESTQLGSDMPQVGGDISPLIREVSSNEPVYVAPGDTANQVLAEILHRSGNVPLDVTISFPIVHTAPTAWTLFFSLLSTSSFRWTMLDLKAPDALWERFVGSTSAPASYPLLRDLHITLWKPSDILTRIIRACANVVTLIILSAVIGEVSAPEDPVLLLSLMHLDTDVPDVLKAITSPALKYLSFRGSIPEPKVSSKTYIIPFLLRSQSYQLIDLDLLWSGTTEDVVEILSHIPTLQSLTIYFSFNEGFFVMMKSTLSFLPQLRKLRLYGHGYGNSWDGNVVLDMVEARLAGRVLQIVDIGPLSIKRGNISQPRLYALNAVSNVSIRFTDSF